MKTLITDNNTNALDFATKSAQELKLKEKGIKQANLLLDSAIKILQKHSDSQEFELNVYRRKFSEGKIRISATGEQFNFAQELSSAINNLDLSEYKGDTKTYIEKSLQDAQKKSVSYKNIPKCTSES